MERYHFHTSSFGLTKWYLDCVDDGGEPCIAYWAQLRWKALSLSYAAVLTGGATREHLLSIPAPQLRGDELTWRAEPLRCEATLRRRAPAFETTLYPGVSWRCEMPSADAVVRVDGRDLRGRGYAEVIEMTVPPWQLPIDELRWGRYSGSQSVVWIDWKGPHPLHVTLVDGVRADGCDVTVSIDERHAIRSAPLAETLASMSLLKTFVPKRLLQASEEKWCSRASLRRGDVVLDRGWAIHEVVTFA